MTGPSTLTVWRGTQTFHGLTETRGSGEEGDTPLFERGVCLGRFLLLGEGREGDDRPGAPELPPGPATVEFREPHVRFCVVRRYGFGPDREPRPVRLLVCHDRNVAGRRRHHGLSSATPTTRAAIGCDSTRPSVPATATGACMSCCNATVTP